MQRLAKALVYAIVLGTSGCKSTSVEQRDATNQEHAMKSGQQAQQPPVIPKARIAAQMFQPHLTSKAVFSPLTSGSGTASLTLTVGSDVPTGYTVESIYVWGSSKQDKRPSGAKPPRLAQLTATYTSGQVTTTAPFVTGDKVLWVFVRVRLQPDDPTNDPSYDVHHFYEWPIRPGQTFDGATLYELD